MKAALHVQVHPVTQPIPEQVRALFTASFPPEERRSWDLQMKLVSEGRLCLLQLSRDGQFVGFVFYWPLTHFDFIEYFAIEPAMRGGGTGSQVMQYLMSQREQIVLEVEPPHTVDAKRRIQFYERLGFTAFPYHYKQPPYPPFRYPLDMQLMQKGMSMEEHTFLQISTDIYKEVYGITWPYPA
jgi:ribosomal protein S18 acetylase RimI-like enzyme